MKLSLLFAFVLSVATAFASPATDTLFVKNTKANFDSLFYRFMLERQSFLYDEKQQDITETDSIIPLFTDSVYTKLLQEIPTLVDLPFNEIIKKHIHFYLNRRTRGVERMLSLSKHYFPMFEEIFDSYNLPIELKYLSIIESGLNPRAYSRAGAAGLWQFIYSTGRMYGLQANSVIDDRQDPIKATHAAAQFLGDLYNRYHDWTLALAAYNCGPGNVNRAIRRAKGKRDYWEIYNYLPRETRGYIPAFVAAAYVMNFYDKHNIKPIRDSLPLCDTVMISKQLHLKSVSEVLHIPMKMLQALNPQYKRDFIPAGKRNYALSLPINLIPDYLQLEDSVYAYQNTLSTKNKSVKIASRTGKPKQVGGKYKLYYTVQQGDNLGYIAKRFRVKLSNLKRWNGVGNLIRVGQKLAIYIPKSKLSHYENSREISFSRK